MIQESNPIRVWLGHIGVVIAGVFLGWIPLLGAVGLLLWNEGRAVRTQRALSEGATNVVSIEVDRLTPANEGRLVHAHGLVTTKEKLTDPIFGVSVQALRLRRVVETYQWRERTERPPSNSGTHRTQPVTYRYDQSWSGSLIDSSSFRTPTGHENPTSMPFPAAEWAALKFQLGAFRLEPALRDQVKQFAPLGIRVGEPQVQVREAGFHPLTASFYRGDNPSFPQVGDVRVVFESVMPTEVSVIAGQEGNTLTAYQTKTGGKLALLRVGTFGATEMFRDEELWNWLLMWACRIGGYLLMLIGVRMVLRPVSLIANLIPGFLGGLAMASGFVGFIFATAVTLMVASLAWVAYRPQVGIPLAGVGVLLSFLVIWITSRRNQAHAA